MKKNMGYSDRLIRLVPAIVFIILWVQNVVTGIGGIILLVIAGILILTSIFRFCPVYKLLGISSISTKKGRVSNPSV